MIKPGKSLKSLCKKHGVRLTVKRGKKRVYKSVKVLKGQCKRKVKKKKKVKRKIKRRRKFGSKNTLVGIISFAKKNKIPLGVAAGILTSFGLGYYVKKKMTEKHLRDIEAEERLVIENILNQPYIDLEHEVMLGPIHEVSLFGKKKKRKRKKRK